MEVKEALRSLLQEMILPELDLMKAEQIRILERITSLDKRIYDINSHLLDQSRRIDAIRDELSGMVGETNKRIDTIRDELAGMIGETNKRIDTIRDELVGMIGETNKRIDRLYEVIVRRGEHETLVRDLHDLRSRVENLERRLAS